MASNQLSLLQEISNRGLQDQLSEDQRLAFDELVSRGALTSAQASAQPAPNVFDDPEVKPVNRGTIPERLFGAGESLVTFGTGAFAQPLAGVAGIVDGVASLVSGGDFLAPATERINQVQQALTFQPRTEPGQDVLKTISAPFEKFGELTEAGGSAVLDVTGSPALATAAQVGLEALPSLFGVKKPAFKDRRQDIASATTAAKDVGLDLEARVPAQRAQIVSAAERKVGDKTSLGEGFEDVATAIERARTTEKARVDQLYTEARNTDAGVFVTQARNFEADLTKALDDFDVDTMPIVKKRLAEINEITKLPDNAVVKLNAVAKFRQRINRNMPSKADRPQQAALGIMKGKLDSFLDSQFNADMITGNPIAVQKWKAAGDAFKQFKSTFDDNKIINQLATQKATPTEIRNWIFGASNVGLKPQAANIVKRIKSIVGVDSPQMAALRQDALFGIMEPLLKEVPDFKAFTKNYDKFVIRNTPLMKELLPDSGAELKKLRAFAGSIDRLKDAKIDIDLNRAAAVTLFGHSLAKKALTVNLAKKSLGFIRSTIGSGNKKKIMSDILGYNINTPLLPFNPVLTAGAIQTGIGE